MNNPSEIEQNYNYFAGKPATYKVLPKNTKDLKEDTKIFLENDGATEITEYLFKNGKFYKGNTYVEE